MKTLLLSSILLFISLTSISQKNLPIDECLRLEGFSFDEHLIADRMPKDTLIDVKNGYYEISDADTKLLQATKFNNEDETFLLVATGFYEDMQCSNYFTNFYTQDGKTNALQPIENDNVLPKIEFSDFFVGDDIKNAVLKYQADIQKEYFPGASLEDIYNELFDMHFILPRHGTKIIVELTVCDYIPLNVVSIQEKDWKIITSKHKSISLSYVKKRKRFTQD